MTDAALLDAARALGKYEIARPRDEYDDACDDDAVAAGGAARRPPPLPAAAKAAEAPGGGDAGPGTKSRVLRHHDKIVRAGNYSAGAGGASSSSSSSSSADGDDRVAPPPALVSALRRIFGSSPDLGGSSGGDDDDGASGGALPELMHAVLNHGVFAGTSSSPSPSPSPSTVRGIARDAERDWKDALRGGGGEDDDGGAGGEDEDGGWRRRRGGVGGIGRRPARRPGGVGGAGNDDDGDGVPPHPVAFPEGGGRAAVDRHDGGTGPGGGVVAAAGRGTNSASNASPAAASAAARAVAPPPARAANLESVVGNACRDAMRGSGTANGRVHGLLVAALSVMTSRMLSREGLEGLDDAEEVAGGGHRRPWTSTTASAARGAGLLSASIALDPTDDASDPLAPLLQVGALLSALPRRDDDGIAGGEFALDEGLLRYFAVASSTYEERIEIQKANLFRSVTADAAPPGVATPSARKPSSSSSSSSSVVTLLGDNADGGVEVKASVNEDGVVPSRGLPDSIGRANRSSGEPTSEYGAEFDNERGIAGDSRGALADEDVEAEASRLLRHIVNIVGDHDDGDEDDSLDEDDSNDDDESSSESEHDEEEGSNDGASDEGGHEDGEHEDEHKDNDNDEETEDQDLRRALSLSLAAEIATNSNSDESHSDDINSIRSEGSRLAGDAGSNASDAATEAAAGGGGAPTKADSADASVGTASTPAPPVAGKAVKGGSTVDVIRTQDNDDNSLPLPSLPSPPPSSILPNQENFARIASEEGKEEWKANSDVDPSAVFEPSALSSFGKLPSSHVLVHLFRAVLALMQDHVDNTKQCSEDCTDDSRDIKPSYSAGSIVSRFLSKQAASAKKKDDHGKGAGEEEETNATNAKSDTNIPFSPDSTTLLLLIASLHLSFHLRNSALAVLNDLLSHLDSNEEDFNSIADFDAEDGFQIANSSTLDSDATDDPLIEKDDPAEMEFAVISAAFGTDTATAASESLETKGLKRKAAAAAHVAALRNKTKQKLVETWRKRVSREHCYLFLNRKLHVLTFVFLRALLFNTPPPSSRSFSSPHAVT